MKTNRWCVTFLGLSLVCILAVLTGCGTTSNLIPIRPDITYAGAETKVLAQDDVSIQIHEMSSIPEEFFVMIEPDNYYVKMCLPKDKDKLTTRTKVLALPKDSVLMNITIQNSTKYLIRLYPATITGYDPSGNAYSPLTKQDIYGYLMWDRPFANVNAIFKDLKKINFVEKQTEIVPGESFNGYMVFRPKASSDGDVWKVILKDVPVQTDYFGKISKSADFEFEAIPIHESK